MIRNSLRLLPLVILMSMTACETVPEPVAQKTLENTPAELQALPKEIPIPIVQNPISIPILAPKKSDIIFAQSSLKALGYTIGKVDGKWGKRSESAIKLFEQNQQIQSANGKLSTLNIYALQNTHEPLKTKKVSSSGIAASYRQTQTGATNSPTSSSIANKLSSTTQNRNAPELIIVDHSYSVLIKPNPYSASITTIDAGTGVYVLSQQNGWYEVETLNNQRGYIHD